MASHRALQAAFEAAQASPTNTTRAAGHERALRASALPNNLPAIITPLIGREREVAEISAWLQRPEARLLTIVGAGGMGKSRLAVAVAQQMLNGQVADGATPAGTQQRAPAYPDGIFFVSLATLTTVAALAPTVAATVGLTVGLDAQRDAQQALHRALQNKRLLLILDNFEHLLAGATFVTELLHSAPGLQILTTSRERLNVRGEQLYPLTGLAYDQAHQSGAPLTAAVQLFVHSAQQINRDFTVQPAQYRAMQQICHFVQGLPLALEMAAAWTDILPLEEIAQEISKGADFLTVDWPDVPVRQRSMRALFQWSWHLLTPAEQQLLRQLTLFNGSFTRAAAEAVSGASARLLTRLLHKSLVHYARTAETFSGEKSDQPPVTPRYELHPLVRQFAAEQLTEPEERATVSARFSAFYLDFLAAREAPLLGRAVSETVAEIQNELDQVRQAWQWAIEQGQWAALVGSAYCLFEFLAIVGHAVESEQLFTLAVKAYARQYKAHAAVNPADQHVLGKLWAFIALARLRQGKATALEAARQAISLGTASASLEAQILGHYVCALTIIRNNGLAEAQSSYDHLQRLFEEVHRQQEMSLLLRDFEWRYYLSLFDYTSRQGQLVVAQSYSTIGLQIAETLGSLRGQLTLRLNLIDLYLEQGACGQVREELEFVQLVVQQMRWRWGECTAHFLASFVGCFFGDYQRALCAGQTALVIAQEIGEAELEKMIALQLAYLYTLVGDSGRAGRYLPVRTPQEQQSAPDHVRYTLLIIETLRAWRAGQTAVAYTTITQAWLAAQAFNNRCAQACALIYRGHLQTELQEWAAAEADYQAALAIFTTLNTPPLALEAQAGLVQLALHHGNVAAAQPWIEALLPALATQLEAVTTPFFIYQIVYEGLAATHDLRAEPVLQQGYAQLQATAASLDAELRVCFLAAFPSHRTLLAAYQRWQAQQDKLTIEL